MQSETLLLIGIFTRLLAGKKHVFVGGNAPVPAAATLLARELSGGKMNVTMLGDNRYWFASDDFSEVFHNAANGRYDATFFGGGQIDAQANINLIGLGAHPNLDVRWPGSRGTPQLYMMIPNAILFTREHSRRVLVPKVDYISAPGVSEPNVYRPGGPVALVTSRCVFAFDKAQRRFRLESLHPGQTIDDIDANTGFEFDRPDAVPETPPIDSTMIGVLESHVLDALAPVYPQFAQRMREELSGKQAASESAPALL